MIPNCAHALLADIVSPFVCHDDELTRDTFGLQKQVEGAKPAMKHCKLNSGIAPMIAPPHCRLPAVFGSRYVVYMYGESELCPDLRLGVQSVSVRSFLRASWRLCPGTSASLSADGKAIDPASFHGAPRTTPPGPMCGDLRKLARAGFVGPAAVHKADNDDHTRPRMDGNGARSGRDHAPI